MSFVLVALLLSALLVPAGWPLMLTVVAALVMVVWQGMANHKRTDELIYGQHRLLELTQELRGKQALIERQNATLAAQVEQRTGELRETNVRMAAANLELLELDKMRSALVSNVSHELRTPLTGILGAAQNLRDGLAGELTQSQREYVAMIENDGARLIRVVNELLDWGRLEAGRLRLQRTPVAVRALAEEAIALLRPTAEGKRVALLVDGAADVSADADADKLKQVLINLLDNAIKFSPTQSQVRLAIADGNDELRITVEDQGRGIDAGDMPHLFERFYRGRSADGTAGSGLGLAIARNIARLHGGEIAVESVPSRGSRFTLTLPTTSTVGAA